MIKNFFKTIIDYKRYSNDLEKNQIIFFSEGNHHWAHLKYLIPICLKELKVKYVTLSLNDDGLKYKKKKL